MDARGAFITKPGAEPAATRSRFLKIWTSSIGLKILMAVTGLMLSGFVLVHMAGNLQIFQGREAIDDYSKLLHKEPAILWTARATLLGAVGVHIWAYLVLTRKNQRARGQSYKVVKHRESSFASRTMRLSGPLLLAFIVFHILHLTTGSVHPDYHEGSVYNNLISGLRILPVAAIYVLAMLMLGFHLWHGVWSLFQTLGADQPRYKSLGRRVSTAFTVVVVAGFVVVPLAIAGGLLKAAPATSTQATPSK